MIVREKKEDMQENFLKIQSRYIYEFLDMKYLHNKITALLKKKVTKEMLGEW